MTSNYVDQFDSKTVISSGHEIHYVEAGSGPLVIFVHGFPESWYSWRHQLAAVAEAGFHAVAMDVRGYGKSAAPEQIEAYAMSALVGDVVAIADALSADPAVVVGHDWGAPIAWSSALLRPDRFRGVVGMSVPYSSRGDTPPLAALRALAGDDLFYIDYFQEPGLVEAEVAKDLASWLRGFYFTASGEADLSAPSMGLVPRGAELRDRLQQPDAGQMTWMTDADFDFYLSEFQRTGLTGGFNRYRNIDRDWAELAPFHRAAINVPALFIGGEFDGPTQLGQGSIDRFDETLPHLTKSVILPQCGHWVQQEEPDQVNQLLVEFLATID